MFWMKPKKQSPCLGLFSWLETQTTTNNNGTNWYKRVSLASSQMSTVNTGLLRGLPQKSDNLLLKLILYQGITAQFTLIRGCHDPFLQMKSRFIIDPWWCPRFFANLVCKFTWLCVNSIVRWFVSQHKAEKRTRTANMHNLFFFWYCI